jgi:gluconate 2-dehydrogenase alpha chain
VSTPHPRAADVAIIGLGAAGGIAAHVLTKAGLEVAALEAGPRVRGRDAAFDEIGNDVRNRLSRPKALHEAPTWRPDDSTRSAPSPWPVLMVNAVGGSTLHYPGLSARLLPWNFASRSRAIERYGPSAIPEGSTLADWPLGYEDLEPCYDAVERVIGVSGAAGNIAGRLDPRGNPFEGPRQRAYPMPPLRRSGWTEMTAEAARNLGWHPYAAPAAVNSEPYNGNLDCTYCGFCGSNGCYRDARGSTDTNVIPRAEASGLLRIETSARVVRIEVDATGLATGVTYVKDGRELFQPAGAVLLGAFTYENTRLLLLSSSSAFPHGLSNNHGQVGKHFVAHVTPHVFGVFPGRRLNVFSGPWSQATCVDDWNGDNFDHTGLGFLGGGMLSASHELKPIAIARGPLPRSVGRWGTAWKAWLASHAQSIAAVTGQFDALSYETNSLDLDSHRRDPYGLPVVRVTHRLGPNELRGAEFLRDKLRLWLDEAGAAETWWTDDLPVEGRHSYGGTRMGVDPDGSVVDSFGFSHEVPNLGVLGTSVFPTAGGHNPTLTLQALAWRTAQRLADAWGALANQAVA